MYIKLQLNSSKQDDDRESIQLHDFAPIKPLYLRDHSNLLFQAPKFSSPRGLESFSFRRSNQRPRALL